MDKASKQYFTTGEVANYCGVTLRTVINWIKQGRLPAHQLPGTRKDNRISRLDLCSFMHDNGIPIPLELTVELGFGQGDEAAASKVAPSSSPIQPSRAIQPGGVLPENSKRELKKKSKVRALVVDDDLPMAKALGRVLRSAGMQVFFAHDGFDAGRMFEKHQPALMTLDLNMPKMDGFAVLDALQDRGECKILVVSALGDTYMQEALAKHADGVMAKPFDNDELLQVVQDLLAHEVV